MEGYLEVETSEISGVAMVTASINQEFIDACVNKGSPNFKRGEQLFDDYHRLVKASEDGDKDSFSSDRNWMIKIIKNKNFFSVRYDASSWLGLGSYQYCIGHKDGLTSLDQVFEHLCYSFSKVPKG